ncbi:MAG: DUF302 domain-containing protein [Rhodospirillales bacterium]|jgi:uncharacterized protein (DUF302 family)|nr:DUF302 domain-containing protein [Rhodospirillales bacterium]
MGLVSAMMFKSIPSRFDYAETVTKVRQAATDSGWTVPQVLDLQEHYHHQGLSDMGGAMVVYFCNARSGFDITRSDGDKPMLVMMPTAVVVYEDPSGAVHVAHMNFGLMRHMFGGTVKKALSRAARNMAQAMAAISA